MLSRAAWARILPFLAYMGFIAVADLLQRAGLNAAQLRWLYPAKIGVVLALLVVFWRQYEELAVPRPTPAALLLSVAAGGLVLLLWLQLDAGWMVVGQSGGYDPREQGRIVWPLALARLAGAALVVPVMEELFWRSFVMRWIVADDFARVATSRLGWKSVLLSSILFGIEHNLWFAGVVAGLGYALLYRRTGNLWSAIVAHGVTNGLLGIWIISTGSWSYW